MAKHNPNIFYNVRVINNSFPERWVNYVQAPSVPYANQNEVNLIRLSKKEAEEVAAYFNKSFSDRGYSYKAQRIEDKNG